ncbi:prenyltransferase [Pseudomonas entomophila]|uniref:prenyltransferase/squalene oxidase repeat-containing protein n=1 Tax=Pseudomonas entomophila TaxID=312306 RepID=UPI001BCF5352|nr:prenyltransferase/squalene oxidase repeat-containing protein [Pseudomonas entomophila]QVM90729.1 prenyltransferase [Pseudomonas entomophila]
MHSASYTFMADALMDREEGGFLAVTDATGAVRISSDKRLEDQVAATLFFAAHGEAEQAEFALAGLLALHDASQDGFIELGDRFWNPHGSGRCRTLASQFDALRAVLEFRRLRRDDAQLKGVTAGLSQRLQQVYDNRLFGGVLSSDWSAVIDGHMPIELDIGAVNLLCSLCACKGDQALLTHLQQHVWKLEDEVRAELDGLGAGTLRNTASRARAAAALARWARANSHQEMLQLARKLLEDTFERLHDNTYGGFWDRLRYDQRVGADWLTSFKRNESPFPIKTSLDVALLLDALALAQPHDAAERRDQLLKALGDFHDSHHGGFFLGKGYFWSTPVDPTVPFIRQFWAPPRQLGVFHIGNLSYLPLHIKSLEGQLACLKALAAHTASLPVPQAWAPADGSALRVVDNRRPLEQPHLGQMPNLDVNLPAYYDWLSQSRASLAVPYGLTAELAPQGFRADRCWQVFSALHVISDLYALKADIEDSASLVACIQASQNPDGGFSEQPGQLSDVFATYCAVISLRLLGSAPRNGQACVAYLRQCQQADGGFGNVPGYQSDIWHSNLAALSLHVLGAQANQPQALLDFILACRHADGGFGNRPGNPPDTFSTYRALSLLHALDRELVDAQATVAWLQGLQQADGPFLYRPGKAVSLVGSYMAVAGLYLLDAEPRDKQGVTDWIARHQKQDGGFGPLNTTSATTDESFTCIQSLLILKGALSKYWVALVN